MFIIVWRGFGIFVPVVIMTVIVSVNQLIDIIMKDPDYSKWNYWPKALGAVLAAIAVWLIGRYLHSRPGVPGFDKITYKEVLIKRTHNLFGINFEYWAFLPLAFSVIGYFV